MTDDMQRVLELVADAFRDLGHDVNSGETVTSAAWQVEKQLREAARSASGAAGARDIILSNGHSMTCVLNQGGSKCSCSTAAAPAPAEKTAQTDAARIRQLEGWLNDASIAVGGVDLDCVGRTIRERFSKISQNLYKAAQWTEFLPETRKDAEYLCSAVDQAHFHIGMAKDQIPKPMSRIDFAVPPETPGPQPVSEMEKLPGSAGAAGASEATGLDHAAAVPTPPDATQVPKGMEDVERGAECPEAPAPLEAVDLSPERKLAIAALGKEADHLRAAAIDSELRRAIDYFHARCVTMANPSTHPHQGKHWAALRAFLESRLGDLDLPPEGKPVDAIQDEIEALTLPTPDAAQGKPTDKGLTEDEAANVLHKFRHAHSGSATTGESGLRDDEIAAFEKWATSNGYNLSLGVSGGAAPNYIYTGAYNAAKGWRAALEFANTRSTPRAMEGDATVIRDLRVAATFCAEREHNLLAERIHKYADVLAGRHSTAIQADGGTK